MIDAFNAEDPNSPIVEDWGDTRRTIETLSKKSLTEEVTTLFKEMHKPSKKSGEISLINVMDLFLKAEEKSKEKLKLKAEEKSKEKLKFIFSFKIFHMLLLHTYSINDFFKFFYMEQIKYSFNPHLDIDKFDFLAIELVAAFLLLGRFDYRNPNISHKDLRPIDDAIEKITDFQSKGEFEPKKPKDGDNDPIKNLKNITDMYYGKRNKDLTQIGNKDIIRTFNPDHQQEIRDAIQKTQQVIQETQQVIQETQQGNIKEFFKEFFKEFLQEFFKDISLIIDTAINVVRHYIDFIEETQEDRIFKELPKVIKDGKKILEKLSIIVNAINMFDSLFNHTAAENAIAAFREFIEDVIQTLEVDVTAKKVIKNAIQALKGDSALKKAIENTTEGSDTFEVEATLKKFIKNVIKNVKRNATYEKAAAEKIIKYEKDPALKKTIKDAIKTLERNTTLKKAIEDTTKTPEGEAILTEFIKNVIENIEKNAAFRGFIESVTETLERNPIDKNKTETPIKTSEGKITLKGFIENIARNSIESLKGDADFKKFIENAIAALEKDDTLREFLENITEPEKNAAFKKFIENVTETSKQNATLGKNIEDAIATLEGSDILRKTIEDTIKTLEKFLEDGLITYKGNETKDKNTSKSNYITTFTQFIIIINQFKSKFKSKFSPDAQASSREIYDAQTKVEGLKKQFESLKKQFDSFAITFNSIAIEYFNARIRKIVEMNKDKIASIVAIINRIIENIKTKYKDAKYTTKKIVDSFQIYCKNRPDYNILRSILENSFLNRFIQYNQKFDKNGNIKFENNHIKEFTKINNAKIDSKIKIIAALLALKMYPGDIIEGKYVFDFSGKEQKLTLEDISFFQDHSDIDLSAIFENPIAEEDLQKLSLFMGINGLNEGFKRKIWNFINKKSEKKISDFIKVNDEKKPKNNAQEQSEDKEDKTKKDKENKEDKTKNDQSDIKRLAAESPKKPFERARKFITKNLSSFIAYPINSIINLGESVFTSISSSFSQAYEFISANVSKIKSIVILSARYFLNSMLNLFNR